MGKKNTLLAANSEAVLHQLIIPLKKGKWKIDCISKYLDPKQGNNTRNNSFPQISCHLFFPPPRNCIIIRSIFLTGNQKSLAQKKWNPDFLVNLLFSDVFAFLTSCEMLLLCINYQTLFVSHSFSQISDYVTCSLLDICWCISFCTTCDRFLCGEQDIDGWISPLYIVSYCPSSVSVYLSFRINDLSYVLTKKYWGPICLRLRYHLFFLNLLFQTRFSLTNPIKNSSWKDVYTSKSLHPIWGNSTNGSSNETSGRRNILFIPN